ncbi:MAG: YihY/virulence factor BrkB family protein [Thermoguttaceae bacterium]
MLTWLRNRLWPALKTSVVRWNRDDGAMLSAAMAYYAAFSLFPLCLVLIAAIGLLTKWTGQAQLYERDMFKFLEQNVGPHLIEQFKAFLAVIQQQAKVGGTIGVLALAVAAIGIFLQLEAMFNRIWQTPPRPYRGWLVAVWWVVWGRCVAFAMLLLAGVLLVALFAANMYLFRIPTQVQSLPLGVWAWRALQTLFLIGGNVVLLGVIYKTIPKAPVRWTAAFGGGILVAVTWQIGQYFLALFVIGEKYSAYGVIGSLIALMLWFYYAAAAVFLGGEFVRALGDGKNGSG